MARSNRRKLHPEDLTIGQLNALLTSYVGWQLSWVFKPEAWSKKTRHEMIQYLSSGHPRPNPPPPPRVPPEVIADLVACLKDPERHDLAPIAAHAAGGISTPARSMTAAELGAPSRAKRGRRVTT